MIYQFLNLETREITTLAEPTEVHLSMMHDHPTATLIVRGQPEGNYIVERVK